jgi:hypothetical protein
MLETENRGLEVLLLDNARGCSMLCIYYSWASTLRWVLRKINCNSLLAAPSMQFIFSQCRALDTKSSSFRLPEYSLGSSSFTPAFDRGEESIS